MNYTVNYTIENVNSISQKTINQRTFNNLIIKIIATCNVDVTDIGEQFSLPITVDLPIPESGDYMDIDQISKNQLVEWIQESAVSQIERLMQRKYGLGQINSLKEQTVTSSTQISGDQFS